MHTRFSITVRSLLTGLATLVVVASATAQSQPSAFPGLVQQQSKSLAVYCTPGHEARARAMADLCAGTIEYMRKPQMLGYAPRVRLLVLGTDDWKKYARTPAYGMPHTANDSTLVVAAEDNAMWRGMVPPAARLTPEQAKQVAQVYQTPSGQVTMMKFFDLLAVHELSHSFYRQAHLGRPRFWLDELFANLLLHTYVAGQQPQLLPALELFPQIVADGTDATTLRYTSLADFEQQYGNMETMKPLNYGWYQCRLHRAAASIYKAGGKAALPAFWKAFRNNSASYTDAELASFLAQRVGPALAQVQTSWPTTPAAAQTR